MVSIVYISFGSDDNDCHRFLLPAIWLLLANPIQKSRSQERCILLRAHCYLYSVHGIFHHHHNHSPVLYYRESYTSRILLYISLDPQYWQMSVLNDDSLISAVNWMVISNNALYTAIDFISQLVLVSVPNLHTFVHL